MLLPYLTHRSCHQPLSPGEPSRTSRDNTGVSAFLQFSPCAAPLGGRAAPGDIPRPRATESSRERKRSRPKGLDQGNGEEEDEFFRETFPRPDQLEKWVDGKKYILVKYSKSPEWVPEEDVGTYRFSLRGYESRGDDGKWVSYAQMPEDTSHLTDAQRERLILELRGQVNFNLSDGTDEDGFRPLPKVPPLERWPYYQIEVSEDLKASPEELSDFQELLCHSWVTFYIFMGT